MGYTQGSTVRILGQFGYGIWVKSFDTIVLMVHLNEYETDPVNTQHLDGLRVVFLVLMPEDSSSNPQAGSIYFSWLLGLHSFMLGQIFMVT